MTPADAATAEVIRQLRLAAAKCNKVILNPPGKTDAARSFYASRAAQQLASLNRELEAIAGRAANVAARGIAAAYSQGLADAEKQAEAAGVRPAGSPLAGSFNVVDRRRAQVLAEQTVNDVRKAVISMRETTGKIVRQTQAENLDTRDVNRLLAGVTIEGKPRQALKELRDLVRRAAIDGQIVTINTRTGVVMNFKPDVYADLVMQTKIAETTTAATMERLRGRGINYVKVIGSNSRRFCTAFVGRVFWIGDGEDPTGQFPSARQLPRGGPPFHPRCTKRFVAFVIKLATPKQIDDAKLRPHEKELLGKTDRQAQKAYSAGDPNRPDRPPAPGRTREDPPPTTTPPPRPLASIKDLISPPKTGRTAEQVRATLELIDQVHRLPTGVRPMPLQVVTRAKYEGQMKTRDWIMQIRASTEFPRSTVAHEVGHFIEHQVLGGIGAVTTHPAFAEWRQAVQASKTFQRVYLNAATKRTRYAAYLASPHEVFARTYSQWIAYATSDAASLAEHHKVRSITDPPGQWDYDEFQPIAEAFELAFARLGLKP